MHALDSLVQHNLIDQNKVLLAYKSYFQLIFLYLYEVNLYEDQLFQQLHHQVQELTLEHHEQLGVVDQNLN